MIDIKCPLIDCNRWAVVDEDLEIEEGGYAYATCPNGHRIYISFEVTLANKQMTEDAIED